MSVEPPRELLEAVLQQPESLESRLVLADWFGEHEDPRGELITVQCTLDDRPRPTPELRKQLKRTESELLTTHRDRWQGDATKWLHRAVFRRGFIELIECYVGGFLQHGRPLMEREPVFELILRSVSSENLAELSECEHLANVRRLTLTGASLQDGVVALMSSPYIRNVRRLVIPSAGLGLKAVEAIAASGTLGPLDQLSISNNRVGNAGLKVIANHERFSGLERLHLAKAEIDDEGVEHLVGGQPFERLAELGLDRNEGITELGVAGMLDAPGLKALRRVELSRVTLSDKTRAQVKKRWPLGHGASRS